MKVNTIYNLNFNAKPVIKKSLHTVPDSLPIDEYIKIDKGIYNDIDKFLNKKITKLEYLNKFDKYVDNILPEIKFTPAEKSYINNLIFTLDLNSDWSKIPNQYLTETMKELLKYKK